MRGQRTSAKMYGEIPRRTKPPTASFRVSPDQPLKWGISHQIKTRTSAQQTTSRPHRCKRKRVLHNRQIGTSTLDQPKSIRMGTKNARTGFWEFCPILIVESGFAWQTTHLSGKTGFTPFGNVMSVESAIL